MLTPGYQGLKIDLTLKTLSVQHLSTVQFGLMGKGMYCPNCGAGHQTADSYCKRCGQWLRDFKSRASMQFGGETPQQNIFTGLFMSALSAVAALISAIALYFTYLGSGDAKWSVYLAAAFCLCIAGWQASSFAVTMKLRRRLKKSREASLSTTALTGKKTSPALESGESTPFISVTAVTERTTELLEPVRNQADSSLP